MRIQILKGLDTRTIVKIFNESFADYFTPFNLSADQLDAKMKADKTDLSLSAGAFDKKKLVGFILHGYDEIDNKKIVYNAGTGVIPKKRGAGLTQKMYQFILPILKEKKIDILQLEVITQNIQAIRSYEKSGFKTERKVLCYKGEAKISGVNNSVKIKNMPEYDWDLMKSFWDVQPTWQNSKRVLDSSINDTLSLGAYLDNELVGYVIFSPDHQRIHQVAINRDFRRKKIASTLLGEVLTTCGNNLSIINVDESSKSTQDFLKSLGFENYLDQYEMKLQLM